MIVSKEKYPHYDVVLMNLFNSIFIDLVNPDLHQELFANERLNLYTKNEYEIANARRMLGNGLFLSEGKSWKMKRKVIQEIFNFNFIKSFAPKIS